MLSYFMLVLYLLLELSSKESRFGKEYMFVQRINIQWKFNLQDSQLKEKCLNIHLTPQNVIAICLVVLSYPQSIKTCLKFLVWLQKNQKFPIKPNKFKHFLFSYGSWNVNFQCILFYFFSATIFSFRFLADVVNLYFKTWSCLF